MKLDSIYVDRAARQFGAQALPDNYPAVPRLNELFGEHTFFLDDSGLKIVEPVTPAKETIMPNEEIVEAARVVELASWADETRSSLAPHERELTDVVILLDGAR